VVVTLQLDVLCLEHRSVGEGESVMPFLRSLHGESFDLISLAIEAADRNLLRQRFGVSA
jgi:hypothetical protein